MLKKTLESPLDSKKIQPVHPKGNQSWMFIWRTDAEAETPIFWPPMWPKLTHWKDPDAGKDWGQEEKGTTDDEMVGWHHRLNGHEFGWTPGVGDGQGGLACCGSWGCKELDMTEWLNWTDILCSQRWRSCIQSAKIRLGTDCGSDHVLFIAKFRLKLKNAAKTIRLSRYDLNHPLRLYNESDK